MSSSNKHGLPRKKYKILFEPLHITYEVDPFHLPSGQDGEEGSILSAALEAGVPIEHACGGVCACATCHVYVTRGLESCKAPSEREEDQMESAPGLTAQSRLACQCIPDGTQDITVVVPGWNRNTV